MALIKFGGGISEMRGKIAGTVFSRNKAGAYARNRVTPVNPQSARQNAVRALMQTLAVAWSTTLSAANRAGWEAYAIAVPMLNRLGETMYLSGFNHFIRSNMVIMQAGQSMVVAGPATLSLPLVDSTTVMTLAVGLTGSLAYDDTMDWCDEDAAGMVLFAGSPQLDSRNFFDGPWRYATVIDGDSVTPPTSPEAAITLPWTGAIGQKMWFYCRIFLADGRVTERFFPDPDTFPAA